MKKKLFYFCLFILIQHIFFLFSPAAIFAYSQASEEQKYDSMQWYFKARYLYEQRKDFDGAKKAIIKACELDFNNAEAFAYMAVLSDTIKLSIPDNFKFNIPEYTGSSGGARRWYINGVEAFNRRDFNGALFCFEQALKDDITGEQISYMINATKREITLAKFREKIEYRIIKASRVKTGKTTDVKPEKTTDKKTKEISSIKTEPDKTESTSNVVEKNSNYRENYLSIKTARELLKNNKKKYDPERFIEWFGFTRYIYNVNHDLKNALLAIDAALLFYDSNEAALKLKKEIASALEAEELAEKQKLQAEKEAIEKKRLERIESEKNKRSVAVSEIVISDKPHNEIEKEIKITGDFTDEDFLADTQEITSNDAQPQIPSNKPVSMPVGEIILVNDPVPSTERKKLIEEAKAYVIRHSKLANEKYNNGKINEALLEYEKIYEKILQIDSNDLKSLYNLVLLYKKMGEQRNAQKTFIRLVNAVNEKSAKYSGSANIRKIYRFVDCTVKAAIINAAVVAYNQKSYYPMNRSNFDLSKLKEKKYLVTDEGEDREIMLSLSDGDSNSQAYKTYKFVITGHECKEGGKYGIGPNGAVTCSVHGDSVIILSGQQLDKIDHDNK